MKLFELVRQELRENRKGVCARDYYRSLGYKKNLNAKPSELRANGVYSIFTEPEPFICKSDLIVGNYNSLFIEISEEELNAAKELVEKYKERKFHTNYDHYAPYYKRILEVGLNGLIHDIELSLENHKDDSEKVETLNSMKHTLLGLKVMIEKYRNKASDLKNNKEYNSERLDFIIGNCNAILTREPQTFAEALQLIFFIHNAFEMENRGAMALGRLDQYLYPFFKSDIEKGILTEEKVIELLENVFIKLMGGTINIAVGGQNIKGECQINRLSYCILWAVKNCNVPGPNLSARITKDTPDDFLDECLKSIGTGLGYPALMNDDINIAALKKYGYEEEDIYDYSMVGCIENFITGMQPPWTDGRFDAPRFFEYLLNRGKSQMTTTEGLDTRDIANIHSMEDFMEALKKQLAFGVEEYCKWFDDVNNCLDQKELPDPFLSCFCYDCIGRGLDIHVGGSKYPSVHGAALMGIGTFSDSLAAVEKVVFIDKEATLEELRDALNNNFEGYEELRKKLLAAPKYGNNDEFVDKYAVWYVDYLASLFEKRKTFDGGGIYIAVAANVSNIYAGKGISATPDGRLKGEPLSDAASPTYGRDIRGATATINSVSKPDYSKVACGTVVNMKFSPSMFTDGKREKLAALIKTYFKKGGQELQVNSTSREILIDALDHPEKYGSLVVRVSGFSAFYTNLNRDVQMDILHRTQQD